MVKQIARRLRITIEVETTTPLREFGMEAVKLLQNALISDELDWTVCSFSTEEVPSSIDIVEKPKRGG